MEVAQVGAVRRCAVQCCFVTLTLAALASGVSVRTLSAQGSTIRSQPLSIRVNPENVRLNWYLHDLAGPALIAAVGGGLVDHLWQKPASWGDDGSGLARRIGSRATQAAVQVTVRHGLAALMHRSTNYHPCECHGFGRLVEHALLETFTDRRADGSRALSVPLVAGAYAGGFSRMAWEPHRDVGDVALGTTLSFGLSAVFNIARELSGLGR